MPRLVLMLASPVLCLAAFAQTAISADLSQEAGWGFGSFYMLETDEADKVLVETGNKHRDVYISGSEDALSRADIAALEGVNVSKITDAWLVVHNEYGADPDTALDSEAGMAVWKNITLSGDKQTSHWLMFEKGYIYDSLPTLIGRGVSGEDELHPLHITSYGMGADPVLSRNATQLIFQEDSTNIVFSGLHLDMDVQSLSGHNLIFDQVTFEGTLGVQNGSGITVRNSQQYDVHREDPTDGGDYFSPHVNRMSGLYVANTSGVLLEGNLWDKIAWEDGYAYDGEAIYGQAPSMYSQNVYVQSNTLDVTFRDNITMRAASFGAQLRGGAYIEDNVFLDNNAAVNVLGGDYEGAGPIGNYSLFSDNLVTSAGHKDAAQIGAISWGIANEAQDTVFLGNIIAHLADPNNPDEIAAKTISVGSRQGDGTTTYDDTITYNWTGSKNIGGTNPITEVNTDGLDPTKLDQTTIQLYTAQLLGKPTATINDLANYLRDQSGGMANGVSDADLIIDYFQQSFGIAPEVRTEANTLRFVPNDMADGVRWDNRMNWDTNDLPGKMGGDSVDLGGNRVVYGGTTRIQDLGFGDNGALNVSHGKLTIARETTTGDRGGALHVSKAGQIWINGSDDAKGSIDLTLDGGRFANTGNVDGGISAAISNGQAIFATDGGQFDFYKDDVLNILGNAAKVGFDGQKGATAVLRFKEGAHLSFITDESGVSTIEEFRSGAMGKAPNVESGINLGQSILEINVAALNGGPKQLTLFKVDELVGKFGEVHVAGLGALQDANLVIDYAKDIVLLNILASGSGTGTVTMSTIGNEVEDTKSAALWKALTKVKAEVSENSSTPFPPADIALNLDVPIKLADLARDNLLFKGNQELSGTRDRDSLDNDVGRDVQVEGFGNDTMYRGQGNNFIVDGKNNNIRDDSALNDNLFGGNKSARVLGGEGHDQLDGEFGNDKLYGSQGHDRLEGDAGRDVLVGGRGNDRMFGGEGRDRLYGGHDKDRLFGNAGNDRLNGEFGNDKLYGGRGNDRMFGGEGRDRLYGGQDDDKLFGNAGKDRLDGEFGNDKLYGGQGHDRLEGDAGRDVLVGGRDNDRMFGGEGRDRLYGGHDKDRLFGNVGNDRLNGGFGNDKLYGGQGNDRLEGDAGRDVLVGGRGNDRFVFGDGSGRDRITDFHTNDILDLMDFLPNGQSVQDASSDMGGNLVISNGEDQIVLLGLDTEDLSWMSVSVS